MSNIQKFTVMEAKVIIVSAQKSNKSENTVWAVAITGEEKAQAFCKSAYKAMRFAFMLKKRTGLNISDNCLSRLSKEIAEQKADKAAEVQEKIEDFCEDHSVDNVLALNPEPQAEQPKKKVRKPRAKKSAQVVALQ